MRTKQELENAIKVADTLYEKYKNIYGEVGISRILQTKLVMELMFIKSVDEIEKIIPKIALFNGIKKI